MVRIKICGIRRIEDVLYLNELKPDYAGFVFAKSRRHVSICEAEKLTEKLDRSIKKVGVFVNEGYSEVIETAETVGLDILQFHGSESFEYLSKFKGYEIWKAADMNNMDRSFCSNDCKSCPIDCILADSSANGRFGGTGKSFDLRLAENLFCKKRFILAGGINADNVEDKVMKIRPFAVDVSSSVETDGFKDYEKMKKIIMKVRKMN